MYRALVTIDGIYQAQVEQARERESCFVLITNLMDADKHPASSIPGEYKQQSRVEARFSFLKSPYLLGQVFLKKQSRIEALGYVLLMALFIATLLERRVRNNLEAEGTPIMIPGKRNTMRPTARMILDMLDAVQVAHVEHEGIVRRVWVDSNMGSTYRDSFGSRALRPISTQTLRLHGCRVRPQMRRWEHLHAERELQSWEVQIPVISPVYASVTCAIPCPFPSRTRPETV